MLNDILVIFLYLFIQFLFIYSDVNECLGDHSCSQECVNTLGTYTCTCNPGYGLLSDKKYCAREYAYQNQLDQFT